MTSRMLAEIEEQPEALRRCLAESAAEIGRAVDVLRATSPRLIVIAARGSSAFAGSYGRALIETTLGVPVTRAAPGVETVYGRQPAWPDAVMIAISQSGQGPDLTQVVAGATDAGMRTLAIVNDPGSPMARAAEIVIPMRVGPEAIPATKSYLAELAVLAAIAGGWSGDEELTRGLARAPEAVSTAIAAAKAWLDDGAGAALCEALSQAHGGIVISRGYDLATAKEIALKLTETSGLHTTGVSAADFLHGHVVLATPETPLLAFRPDGPAGLSVDRALEGAVRYGARQWVVGGREAAAAGTSATVGKLLLDNDLPERLSPLTFAIPGQLLAERVARLRGRDPDHPEGLTKVIQTT